MTRATGTPARDLAGCSLQPPNAACTSSFDEPSSARPQRSAARHPGLLVGHDARVDAHDGVTRDRSGAEARRKNSRRPLDHPSATASDTAIGILAAEVLPTLWM